jgi:predicted DNA binding CopG/RHH family protein
LFLRAKEGRQDQAACTCAWCDKAVTIRLPVADIEAAQEIAERRGVPYQTDIKGLLHSALQPEKKAS